MKALVLHIGIKQMGSTGQRGEATVGGRGEGGELNVGVGICFAT